MKVRLCLLLSCLFFASRAHGFVQCSIEDRIISLEPGESSQLEISLVNPDSTAAAVRVYLMDWERKPDGNQIFFPAGTLANSAVDQLKLAESTILLGPKQEGKVRLAVKVPLDQRGTRTAMLFVEEGNLPPEEQKETEQMKIRVRTFLRYGIKIYVVAKGTEEPGTEIVNCQLEEPRAGKIPVSLELHNYGNVHLNYQGRFELRNLDGEVIETVSQVPFSVLPGGRRKLEAEIGVPTRGKYLLLAVFDYGGQALLAAEAPFEIRGRETGEN